MVEIYPHEKFEGVYWAEMEDGSKRLATVNLAPGFKVYGELLIKYQGVEYRIWNAYRSKLAAAILKGIEHISVKPRLKVLYLGAATGTTASHVSDIVGPEGTVYCVEFAPRVVRELITVCERRKNMIPILADARKPSLYRTIVPQVDAIYCDVAQPEQAKLLADNADMFLKDGGEIMLAIKARSVDVTMAPSEVYKREIDTLKRRGFEIIGTVHLEPFDKAHAMVVARYEKG
ncbi:MAG: fibrillarin-like rRNA/tRNA 2'-O-methyltransferase [Candidatus Methanomethylicota archaeon]|nr:fibrillarin-like rRNA/tRNA 2'-O-methyltransferase [Candidatus Culexmicrobium cathedralense]RLE48454.1 MAG: fibrillarin-like rRNA/tRNA 2'-O-methyltransferase [Candidatus Verstraetearchaeota archaeon]